MHLKILGSLKEFAYLSTKVFLFAVYDHMDKADLSKGYQNPKRKLGVTTDFSDIIEHKFGKKIPFFLCTLKHF